DGDHRGRACRSALALGAVQGIMAPRFSKTDVLSVNGHEELSNLYSSSGRCCFANATFAESRHSGEVRRQRSFAEEMRNRQGSTRRKRGPNPLGKTRTWAG